MQWIHPWRGRHGITSMLVAASVRGALLAGCISIAGTASARGQDPWTAARLAAPIQLDGRPDEAAWAAIPPLPLVTHIPTFDQAPGERSEIRLAYDDDYLYAAAIFHTATPADVRSTSLTRDRLGSDDVFRLLLDTFDDNENAVVFATTPAGVRVDLSVGRDGEDQNYDWNTYWDAATARSADGWTAEVRIPWSSLRFQTRNGRVVMGVIAARFQAAKNELDTWPPLSPTFANAPFRPSIAQAVVFEGISNHRPLYVTPYALGGLTRAAELTADGTAYRQHAGDSREVGLDVKYGANSNFTLDLTANTDFAQVEADDEQVNLTRFPLFFPEKRQFFQERSGVFTVSTGNQVDPSLFFHSRRIGLTDAGEPLRIYGGARLVGRVGGWDLGLLDMHTETDVDGVTENLGVARLRRRIVNDESTLSGALTTRFTTDGHSNLAYDADGRIRVLPLDYLTFQWAQSFDDAIGARGADGGMARIEWARPGTLTSQGLAYQFSFKWSGPDFNPGLGFQPRQDFRHYFANVRYGWNPGDRTIARILQPSVAVSVFQRNADASLETLFSGSYINYEFKSGTNGWFGWNQYIEDLGEPLDLSATVAVPADRYAFGDLEAAIFPSTGAVLGVGAQVNVGSFYDGHWAALKAMPTWRPSPHLELAGDLQLQRISFPSRDQHLDANVLRLRGLVALDTHLSASAFVQYNQAAHASAGNVRIRYHIGEGRDIYLVYNERLNTDRERVDPVLPLSQERALLLKYTYSFVR